VDQYTDSSFNAAELLQFGQVASISFLTEMNDCGFSTLLLQVDARFTTLAFAMGTASNIGTQIATCITYYMMSSTASDSSVAYDDQDTFGKLFQSTSYYKLVSQIVDYYNDSDYTNIGLIMSSTFKSIINYTAPNVKT
jgi:hypothetical protein